MFSGHAMTSSGAFFLELEFDSVLKVFSVALLKVLVYDYCWVLLPQLLPELDP